MTDAACTQECFLPHWDTEQWHYPWQLQEWPLHVVCRCWQSIQPAVVLIVKKWSVGTVCMTHCAWSVLHGNWRRCTAVVFGMVSATAGDVYVLRHCLSSDWTAHQSHCFGHQRKTRLPVVLRHLFRVEHTVRSERGRAYTVHAVGLAKQGLWPYRPPACSGACTSCVHGNVGFPSWQWRRGFVKVVTNVVFVSYGSPVLVSARCWAS